MNRVTRKFTVLGRRTPDESWEAVAAPSYPTLDDAKQAAWEVRRLYEQNDAALETKVVEVTP